MTNREILEVICDMANALQIIPRSRQGQAIEELIDKLQKPAVQPKKGEWIPISSINEIPKEGAYWVTFEYENGYHETSHIGWDKFHEHWDDEEGWALDNEDYIIAYMPYFEPEPYNPKGEQ